MFKSYVQLALRNLLKHRLYAVINIFGLTIGLMVFLLGEFLAAYEYNHDNMFSARDQIYVAGAIIGPNINIGIDKADSVHTALAPLLDAELDDDVLIARTIDREMVLSKDNDNYLQRMHFVDKEFFRIFDFTYLYGDESSLDQKEGIVLTRDMAKKFFGRVDVLGETVRIKNSQDLYVTAVIENLPKDTHFNSSIILRKSLDIIASIDMLSDVTNFEGDWFNLSFNADRTYILLPWNRNEAWLQQQLSAVYERHAPPFAKEFVTGVKVYPLVDVNTFVWDAAGLPIIESVRVLGLLVLLIACVNYTNLATAQNFSRTREVGLRKAFGATPMQLLTQFLVESLTLASVSLLLALVAIEMLLPVYNSLAGKHVVLNYVDALPMLISVVVVVALLAGAYPAFLITRLNPIDSLHNSMLKGRKGGLFRSVMIGGQFAISIFMLSIVLIVHYQNMKVEEESHIFPKSQIVVMDNIGWDEIKPHHETLRQELKEIDGVEQVSLSSTVPFSQNSNVIKVTSIKGDESNVIAIDQLSVDYDFFDLYGVDFLAGRDFDQTITNDAYRDSSSQLNVVINQMAAKKLGIENDPIGKTFYNTTDPDRGGLEASSLQFNVVGLIPDLNIRGLYNSVQPYVFFIRPENHVRASVRISADADFQSVLQKIDVAWESVIPGHPISRSFLDDIFNDVFIIFESMNQALAVFSAIALDLALIGLFGLAAFMAKLKTKEIGMRKVLGANIFQIVRLLIWQFSIPVMWSLLVAIPLAYFASNIYLNFFADRISFVPVLIGVSCVAGILLSWMIVAGHAIKIAGANPIHALRYE